MNAEQQTPPNRVTLALSVLGIVYGDIGTSPIYALRECFRGTVTVPVDDAAILGILSLIFWALVVVISTKYMAFVLRADNHGEGGIFALLALLRPGEEQNRWPRRLLVLVGLFGAALLYGDSMITPAISVLSAVEGLEVAAPGLEAYVVPITVGILIGLFAYQRRGTQRVGLTFGPIMVLWFATLLVLGLVAIVRHPGVLLAVVPTHAVQFFLHHGWTGFLVLGGVFLVVTGGEALYADLGHFGARPIRRVWFGFVLPALLINYFGQGAELLENPAALEQPFFHMAPDWALYPLVALATAATIIASQAVISGAFSLTRQAVQLGLVPRLTVEQTSGAAHGQIYMPAVNWLLMIAACLLVISFGSSGNLAAAYGLSVNATMLVTTILAFNVARERGGWSLPRAGILLLVFLSVDLAFLVANGEKIPEGGWFPLAMGGVIYILMATWRRGSELLLQAYEKDAMTLQSLLGRMRHEPPKRIAGAGVYFTARAEEVPHSLVQQYRKFGVLHDTVVIVHVHVRRIPRVTAGERIRCEAMGEGVYRVMLDYGFMQGFNIPSDLAVCTDEHRLPIDLDEVLYFVGRTSVIAGRKEGGMAVWRDRLYAFMVRNSPHTTALFRIPSSRVIEVGLQLGI